MMQFRCELIDEYGHITTMLDVLEAIVARLNSHGHVDAQMWNGLLRFFREFVHGCHEAKLEILLGRLLPRQGTVTDVDTVSIFRGRYKSGRALFEALAKLDIQRTDLTMADIETVTCQYVSQIRPLILSERLFVEGLLTRALTEADDEQLAAEFHQLERLHVGPTGREWYTQLVFDYRDIVSTWSHGLTVR